MNYPSSFFAHPQYMISTTISGPTVIRVACVEDDPGFRLLLSRILVPERGFDLVGMYKNAEQALSPLLEEMPELVLLDVDLPGWSGIDCLSALGSSLLETSFVMLTGHAEPQHVFSAFKAGARGYLLKTMPVEKMLESVRSAVAGDPSLGPEISRLLISSLQGTSQMGPVRIMGISPRESELLNLLSLGMVAKEAAHEMGISYETVRDYLKTVYRKLGVRSRTEAVLKYIQMRQNSSL
jgi:DNA-binding NarL/FixJ family response regulator